MLQRIKQQHQKLNLQQKRSIFKCLTYFIGILLFIIIFSIFRYLQNQPQQQFQHSQLYQKYLQQYKKHHSSQYQQKYRQFVFYQTYDQIIFHNKKQLDQSYVKGLNQFSDLSEAEFQQMFNIVKKIAIQNHYTQISQFSYDTFDWSKYMNNQIIKDTKQLDLGHVFAVIGVVEWYVNNYQERWMQQTGNNKNKETNTNNNNQLKIGQKKFITFSEQQIIDCCQNCGIGQQPYKSLQYILKNGITTDQNYPFVNSIWNKKKYQCKYPQNQQGQKLKLKQIQEKKRFKPIKSYQRIKDCNTLLEKVQSGPIIVGVDARQWRNYQSGIFSTCQQTRTHYALLVGKSTGYWIIRNNWGKRWGERGYIRLRLGNTCAICKHGYGVTFNQVN